MTGFDDNTPLTLDEAAEVLLRSVVTASTLRAAIGRRELAHERIGRRIMVTPADIRAWRERCRIPAQDEASDDLARAELSSAPPGLDHAETQQALTRALLDGLANSSAKVRGVGRRGARPGKDRAYDGQRADKR